MLYSRFLDVLQLVSLFLGLMSWILLLYCIIRCKKIDNSRIIKFELLSWIVCAISIYTPWLSQYLELRTGDYDSLIDCTSTYHLATAGLLIVSVILTFILTLLSRNKKY